MAVAAGGGGAQVEPAVLPPGYINYFVRFENAELERYYMTGARFRSVQIETGNNIFEYGLERAIPAEILTAQGIPAGTSVAIVINGQDPGLYAGPTSKMTDRNAPGGAGAGDGGGARAAGAAAAGGPGAGGGGARAAGAEDEDSKQRKAPSRKRRRKRTRRATSRKYRHRK